ncbi:unnamed protein product [Kluyveromyces dobzhanskii CBS 2104]|uniref:WGS project CCBQ000000000 data, contig MAT n=1 Tax=Kluyveromyces dobzhanskii CBS 2104 TaxID=1427455 RepID=A0A0A8L1E5_9SACH|nr:unnamed protein product [Kluyveromyces dobzhanskii CBS 2104]
MAEQGCIIEIDSDPELDAQIREEYAPRRLIPDRRRNRPRDHLSRFISSADNSNNSTEAGALERTDTDDLEITAEVSLRPDGPINDDAEYINLDNYRPSGNGIVVVDHREGDDDLMLVEEHINESNRPVLLQLPAGQTLEVNAAWNELPVGRSFQNQVYRNPNHLQRLRRHIGRTTAMFMGDYNRAGAGDSDSSDTDADYIPLDIVNERNQYTVQRRIREQRERQSHMQRLQRAADESIDSLDPDLRSLFFESQSLSRFREGLARFNFPPARLEQLYEQYRDFRARAMQSWAEGRRTRSATYSNRNGLRPQRARGATQQNIPRGSNGDLREEAIYQQMLFGMPDDDNDMDESNNFPGTAHSLQRIISNTMNRRFGNLPFGASSEFGLFEDGDDAANTELIIRMIQEREERDANTRTKKLNEVTKSQQQKYIDKANTLPEGYSASFNTAPLMSMTFENNGKEETVMVTDDVAAKTCVEIPVCVLCGIELGVGIPDDWKGVSAEDKGVSFEALQSHYKFHCPYQTLARPTQIDKDLSRRTYVSSCGHTFCGRCQVRINNARDISAKEKNKLKNSQGPSHPDNYGPKKCPSEGCNSNLRKKGIMREVYF